MILIACEGMDASQSGHRPLRAPCSRARARARWAELRKRNPQQHSGGAETPGCFPVSFGGEGRERAPCSGDWLVRIGTRPTQLTLRSRRPNERPTDRHLAAVRQCPTSRAAGGSAAAAACCSQRSITPRDGATPRPDKTAASRR